MSAERPRWRWTALACTALMVTGCAIVGAPYDPGSTLHVSSNAVPTLLSPEDEVSHVRLSRRKHERELVTGAGMVSTPPALDAPAPKPSHPFIAPNNAKTRVPIRLPAPAKLPLRAPPVSASRPVAFPAPSWAQAALLVLIPGTAHAPDFVPDCSRAWTHKNSHLANQVHPVTGVPFNENGYPVFDAIVEAIIPGELRGPEVSDVAQFTDATQQLREQMQRRPALERFFTQEQREAIKQGLPRLPELTWHHHEDGVTLQLVDREIHAKTGHSGGRELSGGRK